MFEEGSPIDSAAPNGNAEDREIDFYFSRNLTLASSWKITQDPSTAADSLSDPPIISMEWNPIQRNLYIIYGSDLIGWSLESERSFYRIKVSKDSSASADSPSCSLHINHQSYNSPRHKHQSFNLAIPTCISSARIQESLVMVGLSNGQINLYDPRVDYAVHSLQGHHRSWIVNVHGH